MVISFKDIVLAAVVTFGIMVYHQEDSVPEVETVKQVEIKISRKDVECLAKNIYHEARGEPITGQIAVAAVTLNRVKEKGFPGEVCSVVYAPYAFSWTMEGHKPIKNQQAWDRSVELATMALAGELKDPTKGATHFHTTAIKPWWSNKLEKTVVIGNHVFYANAD